MPTHLPQNQFITNSAMPTAESAVAFSEPSGSAATAALIYSSCGDGLRESTSHQAKVRPDQPVADVGMAAGPHGAIPASTAPGTPRAAYSRQKSHAKKRGISWEFSFEQWWLVWQRSGRWPERGGKTGSGYVMCRNGDVGPYSVENVFIATCRENSSKQPRKKSDLPIGVKKRTDRLSGFKAHRRIKGKITYLGTFPTAEQAHAAYLRAWGEQA